MPSSHTSTTTTTVIVRTHEHLTQLIRVLLLRLISFESHVSVARWLTLFSVTRMGGSFSVAQIDRICSARDGARQSAGALDIHAQAGNGLVRAT